MSNTLKTQPKELVDVVSAVLSGKALHIEEEETEESSSSSSSDESENEDGVVGEYTEDGDDGGHENLDDFYVDPRNKMQPPQESGDAEFAAAATRFVATNASDARERRRGEVAYD